MKFLNNMVVIGKKIKEQTREQEWDNPQNPEQATDIRDKEQLIRQKREAERHKNTLEKNENKSENK
ncbi:hypothetical protein FW774_11610 [Pedobacter sp. BS3]|uniref:hypothetical protein n=1 Tax=Pedobacter sp. BS3 TaxID=2567937 RepID=UPI0011EE366E|nr:hypothetical protein [Pedobacter sp. BS3]TZF84081.1 hypothetical protein FW774_11610 [Pedobacter sp. BS3]